MIKFWMEHNEEEWRKRCLGKKHPVNVHSVRLSPEQIEKLAFDSWLDTGTDVVGIIAYSELFGDDVSPLLLDDNSSHLMQLARRRGYRDGSTFRKAALWDYNFHIVAVGDEYVDDGWTCTNEFRIRSLPTDSDGKVSLQIMFEAVAIFAYPQYVVRYDNVDVLKYMINKKIVDPNTCIDIRSLLFFAIDHYSPSCFDYLLSLDCIEDSPSGERESLIHACVRGGSLACLKSLLGRRDVNLDARNSRGETAICLGCRRFRVNMNPSKQERAMVRRLLKAGADPRLADVDGRTPLSFLESAIAMVARLKEGKEGDDSSVDSSSSCNSSLSKYEEIQSDLERLRVEIQDRVRDLDQRDTQNT